LILYFLIVPTVWYFLFYIFINMLVRKKRNLLHYINKVQRLRSADKELKNGDKRGIALILNSMICSVIIPR